MIRFIIHICGGGGEKEEYGFPHGSNDMYNAGVLNIDDGVGF